MKTEERSSHSQDQAMLIEALRSAHELCAYLVNNMEEDGVEASPNIEFHARTMAHAEQFAALVNDARDKSGHALAIIERDLAAATARAIHLRNLARRARPGV